jgi:hypothetical protein
MKFYLNLWLCPLNVPEGCLSALNAMLLWHAVVFTGLSARACYSRVKSNDNFMLGNPIFFPFLLITGNIYCSICNILKVLILRKWKKKTG